VNRLSGREPGGAVQCGRLQSRGWISRKCLAVSAMRIRAWASF